jgi:hypothetical protein
MAASTNPRLPGMMQRTEAVYFLLDAGRALAQAKGLQESAMAAKFVEALHVLGATPDEMRMAVTAGQAGIPSGIEELPKGK